MRLYSARPDNLDQREFVPGRAFLAYREQTDLFEALGTLYTYREAGVDLIRDDTSQRIVMMPVSAAFPRNSRRRAAARPRVSPGRETGDSMVAMISYGSGGRPSPAIRTFWAAASTYRASPTPSSASCRPVSTIRSAGRWTCIGPTICSPADATAGAFLPERHRPAAARRHHRTSSRRARRAACRHRRGRAKSNELTRPARAVARGHGRPHEHDAVGAHGGRGHGADDRLRQRRQFVPGA